MHEMTLNVNVEAENAVIEAEPTSKAAIAILMARIVAGDDAAIFTLQATNGHRVRFQVLRLLEQMGCRYLANDWDEVDGLVTDAFDVIRQKAAGWSPDGGALPWNWAYFAIRDTVYRSVGHRTTELLDELFERPGAMWDEWDGAELHRDESTVEAFERLAKSDEVVRLFLSTLRHMVSERNYVVVLEYLLQQGSGDRSPSKTVARRVGLKPDNVRQVASRTRKRILGEIDADSGLEPLLDMRWFDDEESGLTKGNVA